MRVLNMPEPAAAEPVVDRQAERSVEVPVEADTHIGKRIAAGQEVAEVEAEELVVDRLWAE
ncbi:hypothetical protein RDn1_092 [Candidatus Termititenax dinenymphae]|uniref:Uncharacterized protein n=1 Tax=Candidatus Termititenax dinenymphae TaxID=2218523 RepID=A0A388TJF9_9BACT|nr:hypothetical protein RDn1_092 [Candidatus Termititenax dinenymphae]